MPSIGVHTPSTFSTSTIRSPVTRPSSPMSARVEAENFRCPPSSCEEDTENTFGIVGHGSCSARSSGAIG